MKAIEAHHTVAVVLIFCIGLLPTLGGAENIPLPSASSNPEITTEKRPLSEKGKLLEKIKAQPTDIKMRQKLAYLYYQSKEHDEVIKILEPFSDKLTTKGRYLLFFGYKGKGDILNEIRMLQFLLATDKNDVRALTYLGDAYLRQLKPLEAIGKFRSAIELDKKYEDAYWGIVAAYEKLDNKYELRIIYQDMIAVFGPDARFLAQLCKLYSEDAYFSKATEYCNEAIMKDPKNPENHVYLALALKDSGGEDRAYQILQQSAKRFPSSELTQRNYASVLKDRNNHVASYKHFKAAVDAKPNSAESLVGYAEEAFRLQKYEEALAAFSKACTLQRSYIKNFHKATTELRQNNLSSWYEKYSSLQKACED